MKVVNIYLCFQNIGQQVNFMRANTAIVDQFAKLQANLPKIIRDSGMTVSYVCEKTNIPRSTWHFKLKNLSFTPKEMHIICEVINTH